MSLCRLQLNFKHIQGFEIKCLSTLRNSCVVTLFMAEIHSQANNVTRLETTEQSLCCVSDIFSVRRGARQSRDHTPRSVLSQYHYVPGMEHGTPGAYLLVTTDIVLKLISLVEQ